RTDRLGSVLLERTSATDQVKQYSLNQIQSDFESRYPQGSQIDEAGVYLRLGTASPALTRHRGLRLGGSGQPRPPSIQTRRSNPFLFAEGGHRQATLLLTLDYPYPVTMAASLPTDLLHRSTPVVNLELSVVVLARARKDATPLTLTVDLQPAESDRAP